MDARDIPWLAFVLFIGLSGITLIVILFSYIPVMLITENQCLHAGYRNGKVSITFDRFCVKRVNQTDIVVPLSEALEK